MINVWKRIRPRPWSSYAYATTSEHTAQQQCKWQRFHEVYGVMEIGRIAAPLPHDTREDPGTPSKGICPSSEDPIRFASKVKLIKLCTMVAKCNHVWGFAQFGKAQGHATALDLSSASMHTLQANIQDTWSDYIAECPPCQKGLG